MKKVIIEKLLSKFTIKFRNHTVDLDVNYFQKRCFVYIHFKNILDLENNLDLARDVSDFVYSKFPFPVFIYRFIDSLER